MRFESPWFLLLLIVVPAYFFFKYKGTKHGQLKLSPTLLFSSTDIFSKKETRIGKIFEVVKDILIHIALIFFIIAIARPLGGQDITTDRAYGIDIVLTIDVSGSMLFVDKIDTSLPYRDILGTRIYIDRAKVLLSHNRLNSAKRVIGGYIEKQKFNRIGIVVFGGYSYTRCPLTLDKNMLGKILNKIKYNPKNDGTAIGMGIATAINRLKKSESKSKVIILLTDGVNNAGMIDPLSAANIARDMKIRIYTIGVGNPKGYLAPRDINFTQYIMQTAEGFDEATLRNIAQTTGGKFYKAEDPKSLEKIYDDIDKLEKSKIKIKRRVMFKENFMPFLSLGFIFLIVYVLYSNIIIKIP